MHAVVHAIDFDAVVASQGLRWFERAGVRLWGAHRLLRAPPVAGRVRPYRPDDVDAILALLNSYPSWSNNFPTTANAYQAAFAGGLADALALRLDAQGVPTYASYFGGSDYEEAFDMALSGGLMHLVGTTSSANFPTTANAYQSAIRGDDGFIAVVDPAQNGAASLDPTIPRRSQENGVKPPR